MVLTLTRRIQRLELLPPPPTFPPGDGDWPGDDPPPAWWPLVPPPAQTYLLGLALAEDADGEEGEELRDLLGLLAAGGDDFLSLDRGHGPGLRATPLPLVLFQATALWWAWHAVFHGGGASDRSRRFWGVGGYRVHDACRDRSGASLLALWRASGTRALPPPLLRLLSAS